MSIPIQNLYYLLCYAWDTLEEAEIVSVSQQDCHSMADLFARILEAGTSHLLRHGLDRQYVTEEINTTSLRGKLDLTTTVKQNLLMNSRVHCSVDSLDHDIVHNQILKTTIYRLAQCENLDRSLRDRLVGIFHRLTGIQRIDITNRIFGQVVLHRNNSRYRLPLQVCRLIHDSRLIDEREGKVRFRDFLRNEKAMATMFEKFVFGFFAREQSAYRVCREQFSWQNVSGSEKALSFLPDMRTDVCLVAPTRKIVIDTKYYVHTFQEYFGRESVKSENLYQIYAYLRNLEARDGTSRPIEGVLLYPTTGVPVSLDYKIHGYRVRVLTLNLDQDWQQIHQDLLKIGL